MADESLETESDNQSNEVTSQNNQSDEKYKNGLYPAVIGGVVGAGVGLLASPEVSKKVAGRIGQSEVLQSAGRELRRTAQEMVTEQAMIMLKQSATSSLSKYQQKLLGESQETSPSNNQNKESSSEDGDDRYQELKQENKELNDNLERIEDKLNTLLKALDK
ncbi:gas vesicle protein GvpP [Virgibacillus halodenitrificans]|uniref:GvpT/GvpP family gas vesicle accessory protein n=1 Tax=Virgibacillus halodenitrificans TaxID=1482 RepID=UPI000760D43F|nr:GvpT/GvpP family gas vesicle accessory protein [Virgibacillus halodenitrificans]MCG1028994.1 gas vesicle protein GvpP [Virgibacillus halodenitrificans]WHX27848.1 GvpT/GvpP family gas vesicle accessory protein [Virgibacillus halodenitrificans]